MLRLSVAFGGAVLLRLLEQVGGQLEPHVEDGLGRAALGRDDGERRARPACGTRGRPRWRRRSPSRWSSDRRPSVKPRRGPAPRRRVRSSCRRTPASSRTCPARTGSRGTCVFRAAPRDRSRSPSRTGRACTRRRGRPARWCARRRRSRGAACCPDPSPVAGCCSSRPLPSSSGVTASPGSRRRNLRLQVVRRRLEAGAVEGERAEADRLARLVERLVGRQVGDVHRPGERDALVQDRPCDRRR